MKFIKNAFITVKLYIIFLKNNKYMKKGIYYYTNIYKNIFYLNNRQSTNFIKKINDNFKSKKPKFLNYNLKTTSFNGDLMLLTINSDIKIFNFKENLILTISKDVDQMYRIKNNSDKFTPFFDLTFVEFNFEKNKTIEKYIDFTPISKINDSKKERLFQTIITNYGFLSKNLEHKIENKCCEIYVNFINDHFNFDNTNYYEFVESIPKVIMNGDLSFHNILIDETKLYIIDWEYTGDFFFFYDIFNLLYVDYFFDGNVGRESLMLKYLNGEFDNEFEKYFSSYEFTYNKHLRVHYIIIFLTERIIKLEYKYSEKNIKNIIDNNKKMIKDLYKYY